MRTATSATLDGIRATSLPAAAKHSWSGSTQRKLPGRRPPAGADESAWRAKRLRKMILVTAGLLAALSVAGCGAGAGHGDSYNKGFQWANDNQQTAAIQVSFMGVDALCHAFATQQAQGLNAQEWSQGCNDGLNKVLSTSGGTR
jgi:hypothetical protein